MDAALLDIEAPDSTIKKLPVSSKCQQEKHNRNIRLSMKGNFLPFAGYFVYNIFHTMCLRGVASSDVTL